MAPHRRRSARPSIAEPAFARRALILVAVAFLGLFVMLPIASVFAEALSHGPRASWNVLRDPETVSAIELTLLTAAISVPANALFGVAAAWLLARYDFRGRRLLITLIELPFSVSPVIAGLIFVLLFGAQGLGPMLSRHGVQVIFAVPGIVLATTFVTFPFVAREVLSVLESQGSEQEEAALTLGASGLQILWRVTLPRIKWGLLYGIVLCNARAMGEFGAVSVVSGLIRGETNTMPLHVETLYNEYNFVGAFTVAALLTLLALATLVAKRLVEGDGGHEEGGAR